MNTAALHCALLSACATNAVYESLASLFWTLSCEMVCASLTEPVSLHGRSKRSDDSVSALLTSVSAKLASGMIVTCHFVRQHHLVLNCHNGNIPLQIQPD